MSERTTWLVVSAVVIALCAFFGAKALGSFTAAKAFPASAKPSDEKINIKQTKARAKRSKDGAVVATRNIFCKDCVVVEPGPPTGDANKTSLPLELINIDYSEVKRHVSATIRNTKTFSQGMYWIGDTIPDAGKIEKISGRWVEFINESTNRRERVYLFSDNPVKVAKAPEKPKKPKKKLTGKAKILADMESKIEKVSDNEYVIQRSAIDTALEQPWIFGRMARVVKARVNGQEVGVRLYSIKPNSLLSKIGLNNGDTLHSVNGTKVSFNLKDMLDMSNRLKTASSIEVKATRRGKPVNLKYSIR